MSKGDKNRTKDRESYRETMDRIKRNEEKKGAVAKDLEAIKNAFNYPNICHFVKYDNLVAQPEQEIRKIYKFIGEPYYDHKFENLKQVEVNGMGYDDKIVGKNMHKIKTVVRKEYNPYIEKIPERIRQKYGHIRF